MLDQVLSLKWYRKILILVIVLIYLIFDFFSTYGVTELSLLAKNFSHIDTPFFSSREVYPPWHYILSMFIKCNGILFSSRNRQCLGVSNGYFSVLVACNVF
ncbi:hypothetical protein CsatB_009675 [Cannabis sativa]|uniref:Uncharacterized protein n=1 Tax=Cannabis sativa TaxID=3483 RepID=A0A803R6G3_CANSA